MSSPYKNVCLIGATGSIGRPILSALLADGSFNVTLLRRSSSSSSSSASDSGAETREIAISADFPSDELVSAFRGQDAVIVAFRVHDLDQHVRIAEAAAEAGVRRYIPADFGSCDAAAPRALELLDLYRFKTAVRERCEALASASAAAGGVFTWTALVCGHFFEFSLHHFDVPRRKAKILDGGDIPASASTFRRVAEATVAVLFHPEETRNRTIFVQSFCPTQNDILASLQRVTGSEGAWEVESVDAEAYLKKHSDLVNKGDKAAVEEVVYVLGTVDADWRNRPDFAMSTLGLVDEDLDEVVKEVLAEKEQGEKA